MARHALRSPSGRSQRDPYEAEADAFVKRYESVAFEDVHHSILDLLPTRRSLLLDIGAGSGRDAAALASLGHQMYAVEPSSVLRAAAQRIHPELNIVWIDDALPDLARVKALRLKFDFILLSAVWMHVPPRERKRAFSSLVQLLGDRGRLAISLRIGPPDRERRMYRVSVLEVSELGQEHGLKTVRNAEQTDRLGRAELYWVTVVFERQVEVSPVVLGAMSLVGDSNGSG
jgi:SAM-dependent methyltransferase